jgi:hypothetical protein
MAKIVKIRKRHRRRNEIEMAAKKMAGKMAQKKRKRRSIINVETQIESENGEDNRKWQ